MVVQKENKRTGIEEKVEEKKIEPATQELDIRTTKPNLVKLLKEFNRKHHEPVVVSTYHGDKKMVLVRTPESLPNPNSVYAFLIVKPKVVKSEFYTGNRTFDYLNKFYACLSRGDI